MHRPGKWVQRLGPQVHSAAKTVIVHHCKQAQLELATTSTEPVPTCVLLLLQVGLLCRIPLWSTQLSLAVSNSAALMYPHIIITEMDRSSCQRQDDPVLSAQLLRQPGLYRTSVASHPLSRGGPTTRIACSIQLASCLDMLTMLFQFSQIRT